VCRIKMSRRLTNSWAASAIYLKEDVIEVASVLYVWEDGMVWS
jgi:hypothetical protein